jgi:hypothetical protein
VTDIDLSPAPTERHLAVANTWANLFCKELPCSRQVFIDHYLERTMIHRFWANAKEFNGQKIAACRLGDRLMLVLHRGIMIKLEITEETVKGLKIPRHSAGNTVEMTEFLVTLQSKLRRSKSTDDRTFDSLTSFSKQASAVAVQVLTNDIPKKFGIYPAPKTRYAGYYSIRKKHYIRNYGNALKKFLAEVDQTILFTLRSIRCPSILIYNWLASGASERRLQALKAHPVLIPFEILLSNAEGFHKEDDLTSHIDKGESFFQCLAIKNRTSPSIIKKFGRLSPYVIGSALSFLKYGFDRYQFHRSLNAFELGSKRPLSRKGWKTCLMAMQSTELSERNLAGMPAWESDEWNHLIPALRNLNDVGRYKDILVQGSLRKALSFSREWHERRDEVQTALLATGKYKAYSWPTMLKESVYHEATGLTFSEVITDIALAYEGQEMGHCVGGYATRCFNAQSRIISVKNGPSSVATLEFRPEPTKTGRLAYRIVQAQGPGNTSLAGKPADEAIKWFTKNLRKFVRSYELEVVPWSSRPEGNMSLSRKITEEMQAWCEDKMKKLGYAEDMKILYSRTYEYEEF